MIHFLLLSPSYPLTENVIFNDVSSNISGTLERIYREKKLTPLKSIPSNEEWKKNSLVDIKVVIGF